MIPAKNEKVLGILDFICQKQANSFERLFTTIDVITKEEVIRFWGETTVFEEA